MRLVWKWLFLLLMWSSVASAGIILNDGLDLMGGAEEVKMEPGEKLYLRARHSVWKYPILKGLSYSSDHPSVAYVDRYGWIRAVLPGRAVISVWNESGDNGTLRVLVRGNGKISRMGWVVIIWIGGAGLFFYLLKKYSLF